MTGQTATYSKQSSLKLLGTIRSNIVGVQYYETDYRVDDSIHFDRNPYNEYDENAIEVSNSQGIIGHLKRENSAWLGPIIDEGKIFLKGKIIDEGDNWHIPIEIKVYAAAKGKDILSTVNPDSAEDVIHNHLVDVYKKANRLSTSTIEGTRNYYRGILHSGNLLPETHLIYKLLKEKAVKNRRKDLRELLDNASEYFIRIKYGKPVTHDNLSFVPLIIDDPEPCPYVPAKKALKDETLVIQEIGESGQVSKLRATNKGQKPVMLISGEGLKGAKQDRIVNVTVIIEVNQTVEIPVSCVERGRWSYKGSEDEIKFSASAIATEIIRKSVREDVNKNISEGVKSYESDQDMVWHSVAETQSELNINSETDNLNEVYEAKQKDIAEIVKKIKYVKNSVGIAVIKKNDEMSVDLFDHPSLMQENWKDLIQSVVIDEERGRRSRDLEGRASRDRNKRTKKNMENRIKEFFDGIISNAKEPEESPGSGYYIVSRNDSIDAGTLMVDNRIAHLSGVLNK